MKVRILNISKGLGFHFVNIPCQTQEELNIIKNVEVLEIFTSRKEFILID